MNQKGATVALILIFLPICFAIISMIISFEVIDLMYLAFISTIIIKYYIAKRKA